MKKTESIYSLSTQSYNKDTLIEYLKKAISILENEDTPLSVLEDTIKYDMDIEISTSYKL